MCRAKISYGRNYRVAEAVLQEAFDWVQESSVAADNNGIYAEVS